jgi:hypothetical protein
MNNLQLDFYYDIGHGWLKVTTAQLNELGIYNQVSNYSYINVAYSNDDESYDVYLEEDCDAPLFLNALKDHGIEFTLNNIDEGHSSFIRLKHRFPSLKTQNA